MIDVTPFVMFELMIQGIVATVLLIPIAVSLLMIHDLYTRAQWKDSATLWGKARMYAIHIHHGTDWREVLKMVPQIVGVMVVIQFLFTLFAVGFIEVYL